MLLQAGIESVTPGGLVASCAGVGGFVPVAMYVVSRSPVIALAFGLLAHVGAGGAGAFPAAAAPGRAARPVARGRRQPCFGGTRGAVAARGADAGRHAWAGRAACAVPAVRRGLPRDRPVLRVPRPAQGRARRPGRRPHRRVAADGAARSAAPTSAGCCARCRRSCVRTPAPAPSSRPGRAGRSTRRGWPSPRRGSCSPCCRCGRRPSRPTTPPPAWSCSPSAAALCLVAYRVMLRIGRLPEEERVLR